MSNIIKFEEHKKQLDMVKTYANIAVKSGKYKDYSEADIMNIMLTASDLGISPMKALNGGFYIVNGKISMSTAMMADRIRQKGHSIRITEWTKEKCVVLGIRKDNGDSVKFEFTLEDASAAGLLGSPTWKKWPKQMLYNRAMSTLARTLFPDVVGNAYSEDEKHDITGTPPEKRPEEDPDTLTVNTETGEIEVQVAEEIHCLNAEHLLEITDMLYGNEALTKKLLKAKKVDRISDLKEADYENIKEGIRRHLERETSQESAG